MTDKNSLASDLRSFDSNIFPSEKRQQLIDMWLADLQTRCREANRKEQEAWAQVRTKEDWHAFAAPRIEALRESLGIFPPPPKDLKISVTNTVQGDGFSIENLTYESRPDITVTANLYLPSPCKEKMPAIIIIHSHHNPKTQGELQDMGMTWARAGSMVMVMDQLSYGERRQHPAARRQDYRFRYINNIQLDLIGDSLMGWMVWDIMRGIDLLMKRTDVENEKVILIGAVAGGGDPAAVTAALDPRVACVIPFNFGGPQPETVYPLPENAEGAFNYMGEGSWEETRNLRLSGKYGFFPWVIVGSAVPRYLIYAHEFSWDKDRDPVWKQFQQLYALFGVPDRLASLHGKGKVTLRPPEATHCNNVGAVHRTGIYPPLERWFGMPVPEEYENRLEEEQLKCFPPGIKARPLHELYSEIGASRARAMRDVLSSLSPEEKRSRLRKEWAQLLGNIDPKGEPAVRSQTSETISNIRAERIELQTEPGIVLPLLILLPGTDKGTSQTVIALAHKGKEAFLAERIDEIVSLLENGIAVCLPDVRGTGEASLETDRSAYSKDTAVSSYEWMLGQTLVGSRLRDLRAVMEFLRTYPETGTKQFALWGDSFAPVNKPGQTFPPLGEGDAPDQSEPLGGLLALFGSLYEDDVCAVAARGMVAGYQSVLTDRFCSFPHDAVVPGALTAGDLSDIAALLAPRPLRLEGLVDGRNCLMPEDDVSNLFAPAVQAYSSAPETFSIIPDLQDDLAAWLIRSLNETK